VKQPHHVSADELISYQISNLTKKDVEDFAAQFKQFTGMDFTDKVLLTLEMWGEAAAVDVSMAELNNVIPSSHDSRHCRTMSENDTTCFEQWLYTNLEAELPSVVSEKGSQRTKMVTSDRSGREEAVQFCQGLGGVIACVIDIENKSKAYWFGLKHDEKGLIAQIYLPKPPKKTQ
jgi:TFIIF-interacting CTD phosphatase-like protein